jgi:hypothetical protein
MNDVVVCIGHERVGTVSIQRGKSEALLKFFVQWATKFWWGVCMYLRANIFITGLQIQVQKLVGQRPEISREIWRLLNEQ